MSTSPEGCPRIGLLNLMPAPVLPKTEDQWREGFGVAADIVPVKFDLDPRARSGRAARFVAEHTPISDVQDALDGLIITGANLEINPDGSPLPFADITYIDQLHEVIDWAEKNTKLTVYSCLASHIALSHLYGLPRDMAREKTFGVYCHEVRRENELTRGLQFPVRSPHSRWGNVPAKLLEDVGVEVLLDGFEPGWLLAEQARHEFGKSVFLQGHPEYQREDLAQEYRRDAPKGMNLPENYFPGDDPSQAPRYSWCETTTQLFTNMAQTLTDTTAAMG